MLLAWRLADHWREQDVKMNYVLIDYENVPVKSLAHLKGEHFQVRVFLGPKNPKLHRDLVIEMQRFGERGEYIVLEAGGKNALDFHIAYYLGKLAAADPTGFFHVISEDTGFDPLLKHLKTKDIFAVRSVSIEAMPCFGQVAAGKIDTNVASDKAKPKSAAGRVSVEDLIKVAADDLIKRKTARPGTLKKLLSTIHAKCGKELPAAIIDAVYEGLVERGYVTVVGTKVTYALPEAHAT